MLAMITLTADISGIFEVELEESFTLPLELEVSWSSAWDSVGEPSVWIDRSCAGGPGRR